MVTFTKKKLREREIFFVMLRTEDNAQKQIPQKSQNELLFHKKEAISL